MPLLGPGRRPRSRGGAGLIHFGKGLALAVLRRIVPCLVGSDPIACLHLAIFAILIFSAVAAASPAASTPVLAAWRIVGPVGASFSILGAGYSFQRQGFGGSNGKRFAAGNGQPFAGSQCQHFCGCDRRSDGNRGVLDLGSGFTSVRGLRLALTGFCFGRGRPVLRSGGGGRKIFLFRLCGGL